jgi:hypothetical protein
MKMFDVAISSSSSLKLCHMHACNGAERGKLEEGSGQRLVGNGTVNFEHGPKWSDFHALH